MNYLMKNCISVAVLVILFNLAADGGSLCPPREDIYPCLCSTIQLSKKNIYTIVSCRHLPTSDSLRDIFPTLRHMRIDRFIIYDSFWETLKLGNNGEQKQTLPTNWLALLRIKELKIIDSVLSSCFACDSSVSCRNLETVHFEIVNSSLSETLCPVCSTSNKFRFSWAACMNRLKYFYFTHNKISSLKTDSFPMSMSELLIFNMSHNEIKTLGLDTLQNFPKIQSLDLSHNMITSIPQSLFGGKDTAITFIDLSWNHIKTLSSDLFRRTPFLKTFLAANNYLEQLPEDHWEGISNHIRTIDLRDNMVDCDCNILWINCTFAVHVNILGDCINPEYENSPLRRVSKFMGERCVDGVLKERTNETKEYCTEDRYQKRQKQIKLISAANKNEELTKGAWYEVPDFINETHRKEENE